MDLVECTWCEAFSEVAEVEDVCPNCRTSGFLMYVKVGTNGWR